MLCMMYFFDGKLFDRIARGGEASRPANLSEFRHSWRSFHQANAGIAWPYTTTTSLQRFEFVKRYVAWAAVKGKVHTKTSHEGYEGE